jgi:peptidoglycan hydrolase-like protein with peptidoglycan-binding domain
MKYFAHMLTVSCLAMLTLIGGYRLLATPKAGESKPTMSHPGDTGEEIVTVQLRLAELGYEVSVTGVYDLVTAAAVKRFQEETGIDASGVANAETMYRLGLSVSLADLTRYEERRFLASTIDAACPEASYLTKVALAGLLFKRKDAIGFPDSLPDVVFGEPHLRQALLHNYSKEPSSDAWRAVRDAAEGMSPCPDALYFYRKGEGDDFLITLKTVFKNGVYIFAAPPAA